MKNQKLSLYDKIQILDECKIGLTNSNIKQIAKKYNISKSTIYNIIKDYKNIKQAVLTTESSISTLSQLILLSINTTKKHYNLNQIYFCINQYYLESIINFKKKFNTNIFKFKEALTEIYINILNCIEKLNENDKKIFLIEFINYSKNKNHFKQKYFVILLNILKEYLN